MTPEILDLDERLMRRALALARRGLSKVSPNPMVGCVLLRRGRVVGEGFHKRFGGPHAEAIALAKAGARAKGATAYVSLEPCCHFGKTPPCTRALIQAGVRRVVAAMKDPNRRVNGKGLRELKSAGIAVRCGVLEEEAKRLNKAFLTWVTRRRPYVVLKAGVSLDGRMETAGGRSKWITSKAARDLARRMRREMDAILVGVDTVLKDNPRLTAPGDRRPLRVILDSRLRTPRNFRVLNDAAPTLIATSARASKACHLRVPKRGSGLDLKSLLKSLAQRGIASLLVEGGSKVHTAFLEAGLVDEVRLFMAPRLIGGAKARSFFEGRGRELDKTLDLKETSVRRVGPDILVTGTLA